MPPPVDAHQLEQIRARGPEKARDELVRLASELDRHDRWQEGARARRRALMVYLVTDVGHSQREVAELAGVSPGFVAQEGARPKPKVMS